MRQQPKRAPLPPQFPRTLIHHEPDNSHCQCGCALKRISEDASEKLDYTPGVVTVERHFHAEICGITPSSLMLRDFDYYLTKGAAGQMFVRFACLIEWIHVIDYRANLVLIQEFVHSVK